MKSKYKPWPGIKIKNRTWPDNQIKKLPVLCSVDLRDGNQALADPMNVNQKLKLFKLLIDIGFKEIEVGYPSASQIEFDFIRQLIEDDLIPDDVSIQVLIPCIEKYIIRSLESLQGAKKAILHLYNSTSILQRKITFKKDKNEIKKLAVFGTKIIKQNAPEILAGTDITLQYSPESFSDTESEYALEVCEAVMETWEPDENNKIILNLPETVEWAGPNIYADQIEWIIQNLSQRNKAIISVHTHNDRGTGVAAAELAMLAGAERIEGTLFGNGERTGNLDLITLSLNLFSDGINIDLDLSNIPRIKNIYEECTKMKVPPRHPYAGDLVFTAFSGSHQDAIKKGMDMRKNKPDDFVWEVPYLPIDPMDIGRTYEAIIRINSQSGKGGIAYILQTFYKFFLPKKMHPEVGKIVNNKSDELGRELTPDEIYNIFENTFLNKEDILKLLDCHINIEKDKTICNVKIQHKNKILILEGQSNGPISAFSHALEKEFPNKIQLLDFSEQAIENKGAESKAVAYIQLKSVDKNTACWGVGLDDNISIAGIKAFVSAFNRLFK